ncbi:hypothetical protein C7B65_13175 [Phormidesmis priestleyi ULC007]|uniref:EF-hand domain-containing protein n=1 Tax=Phormidesmis priestleyi ULC007 TaxID=1920490 RepID=A0A2T1DET2_9CYAN|nr:caspase family protein [Phormidesmis priestleyi]PSB18966.1 hypothetical protein C7B65_13175 [Phormidesmis priestleyi ULC007]PZO53954.1 MAG: hypothetical protein DCF14_03230 [Phormidesmis priestleyi]
MAKVALLIGVSEYEPGLNPLPSAAKDIKAMQQVLQHPEMGNFTASDIRVLENPDCQAMEEAIETLFASRKKDDLVLLFFSGHGIKDDQGRLYLSNAKTRTNQEGLVRSTAVPASIVQESMTRSRSKRQVVILDCCFSGAFAEGMLAKDDGSVDINSQLGGEGRAILTSSTSTQYSFEQQGSDLSVYTRYLIEGIETGAADQDNDGSISIDELHEYAKRKVQETAPAMKPEIYAVKEGFKILLAKASLGDPKLRYRKDVEHFASRGEISEIARMGLEAKRAKLGLLPEEGAAIEAEVVKPYQEYKQSLRQYEQEFNNAVKRQFPFSSETRSDLKYFQQALGLRDEDVAPIEAKLNPIVKPEPVPNPSNSKPSSKRGGWLVGLSLISTLTVATGAFFWTQLLLRPKVSITPPQKTAVITPPDVPKIPVVTTPLDVPKNPVVTTPPDVLKTPVVRITPDVPKTIDCKEQLASKLGRYEGKAIIQNSSPPGKSGRFIIDIDIKPDSKNLCKWIAEVQEFYPLKGGGILSSPVDPKSKQPVILTGSLGDPGERKAWNVVMKISIDGNRISGSSVWTPPSGVGGITYEEKFEATKS